MKDVTDADLKSSGTKLAVSKVQGRSRPFDESSGTSLPILPFHFNLHEDPETARPLWRRSHVRAYTPSVSKKVSSLVSVPKFDPICTKYE
jgi:hypothetical protein